MTDSTAAPVVTAESVGLDQATFDKLPENHPVKLGKAKPLHLDQVGPTYADKARSRDLKRVPRDITWDEIADCQVRIRRTFQTVELDVETGRQVRDEETGKSKIIEVQPGDDVPEFFKHLDPGGLIRSGRLWCEPLPQRLTRSAVAGLEGTRKERIAAHNDRMAAKMIEGLKALEVEGSDEDELRAFLKTYGALDTNRDGYVSRDELRNAIIAYKSRKGVVAGGGVTGKATADQLKASMDAGKYNERVLKGMAGELEMELSALTAMADESVTDDQGYLDRPKLLEKALGAKAALAAPEGPSEPPAGDAGGDGVAEAGSLSAEAVTLLQGLSKANTNDEIRAVMDQAGVPYSNGDAKSKLLERVESALTAATSEG